MTAGRNRSGLPWCLSFACHVFLSPKGPVCPPTRGHFALKSQEILFFPGSMACLRPPRSLTSASSGRVLFLALSSSPGHLGDEGCREEGPQALASACNRAAVLFTGCHQLRALSPPVWDSASPSPKPFPPLSRDTAGDPRVAWFSRAGTPPKQNRPFLDYCISHSWF